jgi:hypothetical protein
MQGGGASKWALWAKNQFCLMPVFWTMSLERILQISSNCFGFGASYFFGTIVSLHQLRLCNQP